MEGQGNTMSLEQQLNVAVEQPVQVIQPVGKFAFFKELPKKLMEHKMYLLIIVGVIVLAVVGYFVYKKYIKKTPEKLTNINVLPAPLQVPIQQPSQNDILMLQKQLMLQPKLNHPGNNDTSTSESESSVQANEPVNVAKHNLTVSEVADINKKIEQLKSA